MGVGVSAHRLAGAVAAQGGVGTLSAVDLRRHHPDLMARTEGLALRVGCDADTKSQIDAANLEAVEREVRAARIADLNDPRFDFERVIPRVIPASLDFLREAGLEGCIPLIAAGGIRTCEDISRLQALGAAGVQLGTPFAVTTECDASDAFKRVLAEARDEDLVEFTSVAGLPARAVGTPWLRAYLKIEPRLQAVAHAKSRCTKAFDCLAQCGLRDGTPGWGQFCIDNQLAAALRGDLKKGLYFRGVGALPFGAQIRSVRALIERLLTRGLDLPAARGLGAGVTVPA